MVVRWLQVEAGAPRPVGGASVPAERGEGRAGRLKHGKHKLEEDTDV